ncbi:MAG TPA: hypothetical protein VEG37_06410 [Burkholderiales bacterium]|nr:hypothetical protein [Burkholderiales bacterium]
MFRQLILGMSALAALLFVPDLSAQMANRYGLPIRIETAKKLAVAALKFCLRCLAFRTKWDPDQVKIFAME